MYFHNGNTPAAVSYGEWHHDGVLSLVEFSKPIDMHLRCNGDQWSTIKVERSPLNIVAVTAVDHFAPGLWDPWSIEYSCQKQ